MMASQKKPDFSVGGIVDPEFIPPTVQRELLLHLKKSRLTGEQKAALIECANVIGQEVVVGELTPAQMQRQQLKRVASAAKRLLQTLKQLSKPAMQVLDGHTTYLAFGSGPPIELEKVVKATIKQPGGTLLSTSWDYVEALEKAAEYAAQQFAIDRTTSLKEMHARDFVSSMAESVRDLTGKLPPKDKASWFACFASCLGNHLGLPIGPRIVASGIEAIR